MQTSHARHKALRWAVFFSLIRSYIFSHVSADSVVVKDAKIPESIKPQFVGIAEIYDLYFSLIPSPFTIFYCLVNLREALTPPLAF